MAKITKEQYEFALARIEELLPKVRDTEGLSRCVHIFLHAARHSERSPQCRQYRYQHLHNQFPSLFLHTSYFLLLKGCARRR